MRGEPFLGAPKNVLHSVGKDLSWRGQIPSCYCDTGRVCGQSGPRPVRQPYAWICSTEVRSGRPRDGRALAQRAEPRISIPSAIVADPASQVSFTIDVVPRDSLPITGFIRVRGLPQFVSIDDGHAIAPGSWAVPLYALPALRLNIPRVRSGRTEVEIALMSIDGRTSPRRGHR